MDPQELNPKPGEQMISHQVLSNFLLLATKQKSSAEQALQEFMNIASQESYKEHVGAILGMATAYMILKQVSFCQLSILPLWNFLHSIVIAFPWLC